MPVTMKPVQSSNLDAIGYDHDTKTLHVRFKGNSGTYTYEGVPADVHDRLTAPNQSIGGAFHKHVKGKFPHTKV